MKRDKARLWLASAPQGDGSRVYAYTIKECHGRTWQSKRGRRLADTPCDPTLTEHSFNPPTMPMNHSTSSTTKPSPKTLAFIRAFARLYTSAKQNEAEARRCAAAWAAAQPGCC